MSQQTEVDLKKLNITNDEEWVAACNRKIWLVEYILQFITSPMWEAAVDTFIEENCLTFEDLEESPFEHFKVHKVASPHAGVRRALRRPAREVHHGDRHRQAPVREGSRRRSQQPRVQRVLRDALHPRRLQPVQEAHDKKERAAQLRSHPGARKAGLQVRLPSPGRARLPRARASTSWPKKSPTSNTRS